MARLNIERQNILEPKRMEYAVEIITRMGFKVINKQDNCFSFFFSGHPVTFFPYSGWATGKSIKDGRGLDNLLKQLK